MGLRRSVRRGRRRARGGSVSYGNAASSLFLRNELKSEDAAGRFDCDAPRLFRNRRSFSVYYFLHGDISIARFRSLLDSEHAVEKSHTKKTIINCRQLAVNGFGKSEIQNQKIRNRYALPICGHLEDKVVDSRESRKAIRSPSARVSGLQPQFYVLLTH